MLAFPACTYVKVATRPCGVGEEPWIDGPKPRNTNSHFLSVGFLRTFEDGLTGMFPDTAWATRLLCLVPRVDRSRSIWVAERRFLSSLKFFFIPMAGGVGST